MNEPDKHDCIVVRCPGCKRVVYAEPHVLHTDMFRDVGEMVRDGASVEHMTVEEVRKSDFGCKCESE